jgi:hypothetical protein
MRTVFFLLVFLFTVPEVLAESAERVPTFDIDRNCSSEASEGANVQQTKASCQRDEADAKKQLDQRWSRLSADAKRQCVKESSIGGDQSYVELLTCLQMSSDWSDDRTVGEEPPNARPH